MQYSIRKIIQASINGDYYSPSDKNKYKQLSFITSIDLKLKESDIDAVEELFKYIENTYNVKLNLVGGGRGCTKLDVEVEGCPQKIADFIDHLTEDEKFNQLAARIKLRVLFSRDDGHRRELPNSSGVGMKEKDSGINININGNVAGFQVGTSESSQKVKQHIEELDIRALTPILSELKKGIEELSEKAVLNKGELIGDFEHLVSEMSREKPRKSIMLELLNNLGSVASLTSIVDRIYPFLPLIGSAVS